MSAGIDAPGERQATILTAEREPGGIGPPPGGTRTEIRWARQDGVELVVKAGGDGLRDRMRREADVLRRCAGLPVVELVECTEGADHTEVVTRRFGSVTLADAALLDPEERGAALAGFCEALRMLHEAGWAHGAIDASHVLVSPDEGVRLCSLAEASPVEGTVSPGRSADLDALSVVVVDALQEPAGFDSFVARRRWNRAARRAVSRLGSTRGLLGPHGVLDALRATRVPGTAPHPSDVDQPDPASGEPDAPVVRRRRPGRASGRVRGRSALVVAVVASLAVMVAWAIGDPVPRIEPPSEHAGCPDVDGDGDCEVVIVEEGDVMVEGRRFEVGRPDDVVRVGDWECDGVHTAAVFRPSTGDVFAFDGWAEVGHPLDGHLLGTHRGAVEMAEVEGCGPVRVIDADGSVTAVQNQGADE